MDQLTEFTDPAARRAYLLELAAGETEGLKAALDLAKLIEDFIAGDVAPDASHQAKTGAPLNGGDPTIEPGDGDRNIEFAALSESEGAVWTVLSELIPEAGGNVKNSDITTLAELPAGGNLSLILGRLEETGAIRREGSTTNRKIFMLARAPGAADPPPADA